MTRLHIRIARARAERVGDTIEIPAEIQARLDDEENRDKRLDLLAEAHRPWMIPHWTLHDLRRTLITQANEHSLAAPHIIEVFVNHISGPVKAKATVAGVYNRAIYLQQPEKFARRWADRLMSVVS